MSRLSVTVTPEQRTAIRARAAAHGISVAAFLRAAALGERPTPTGHSAVVDDWWDNLPAGRRAQVHRWLTDPGRRDEPMPGQTALEVES